MTGIMAPVSVMVAPLACSETVLPPQVVEPLPAALSEDGKVSVKLDWVSAKAFVLLNVTVNVDATVGPTVAGENAAVMVGACGFTATAVKHEWLPADAGAVVVALVEPTVTVAMSVAPTESVTVRVRVPVPITVTCALLAPETIVRPPLAAQA